MKINKNASVGIVISIAIALVAYEFVEHKWRVGSQATPCRLSSENFPLIRIGMSEGEVEELLGGPPGNYGYPKCSSLISMEPFDTPRGAVKRIWCDETNYFEIAFDAQRSFKTYFVVKYRVVGHHKKAMYLQFPEESESWGGQTKQVTWPSKQ